MTFSGLGDTLGLPHVTTTAMACAKDGTMWIGTRGGLTRYDGQRVRNFKQRLSDANSLPDNYVRSLLALPDGGLLIGTNVGGLARYEPKTGRFLRLKSDGHRIGSRIFGFTPDGAGGAYIATDAGVHHYIAATDRVASMAAQALRDADGHNQVVFSVRYDADGTLWAGADQGLWVRRPGQNRFEPVRFARDGGVHDVWAILRDRRGRLWVGTGSDGIYMATERGDRPRFTQLPALAGASPLVGHRTIRSMLEDGHGRLWFATDGMGIVLVDPARNFAAMSVRRLAANPLSLPGDTVRSLALDGSGGIWAATEMGAARTLGPGGGVLRIGSAMPNPHMSLSDDNVRGILVDRRGLIWLGMSNGTLDVLDRPHGEVRRVTLRDRHVGQDIKALLDAADGSILIGARGVLAINPVTLEQHTIDVPGLGDLPVISLAETPDSLLIGTYKGLFVRRKADGRVWHFQHDDADGQSLPNNEVINIIVRSPTSALIGSPAGVAKFDLRTGRFTTFSSRSAGSAKLPQDYAGSIVPDGPDIWVGTYGGVAFGRAAPGGWRFQAITEADGLAGDNVAALMMDGRRRIWAASAGGISVIDCSGRQVRTMSQRDGLSMNAFNQLAAARLPDGSLLFGSPDGLMVLQPDLLLGRAAHGRQVQLIVSAADIDGHALPIDPTAPLLSLERDGQTLRVDFALTDYNAPEDIRYGYRLDGFDRNWMTVPAGTPASATYTNLPVGSYWLDLRADIPGLASRTITRRIRITVEPQWYETWPARIAMVLVVMLALAGLVWLVTTVMRRRARMLETMVAERTQELRAANAQLDRLASTDPLTGLANRRTLMNEVEALRERAIAEEERFAFALLDVDHFKRINDRFGHSTGDEVLVQLSARLQQGVRVGDTLARYGGEEIAILLPGTTLENAMAIVDRLRHDVASSPFRVGDRIVPVTFSGGVAEWQPGEDVGAMIRRADSALYHAKRNGRDQVAQAA
ncbi:ligand-binding sensor domain-containing diguanylate cyclase [uncultured Sphingomonas sp.]|uniref:ligand-binding sensor domain-containing diguanylate cyclase n=1 Tax=uncultured Sphingomonas sp. TaxID=158754 RepID=UPI0025DB4EDC|nr:ligand-binding sensor domain-containing diguanylate cyclase [uncultured Sphingomonas sp.]